jgi:hypothetical protein
MGLDIRIPLGYIFLILGGLLLGYGIATYGSPMYATSVGINLNLIVGIVMFLFGAIMRASVWAGLRRRS